MILVSCIHQLLVPFFALSCFCRHALKNETSSRFYAEGGGASSQQNLSDVLVDFSSQLNLPPPEFACRTAAAHPTFEIWWARKSAHHERLRRVSTFFRVFYQNVQSLESRTRSNVTCYWVVWHFYGFFFVPLGFQRLLLVMAFGKRNDWVNCDWLGIPSVNCPILLMWAPTSGSTRWPPRPTNWPTLWRLNRCHPTLVWLQLAYCVITALPKTFVCSLLALAKNASRCRLQWIYTTLEAAVSAWWKANRGLKLDGVAFNPRAGNRIRPTHRQNIPGFGFLDLKTLG